MLKSCKYCGRIHDEKHICKEKQQTIKRYKRQSQSKVWISWIQGDSRRYLACREYKGGKYGTPWGTFSKK